MSGRRLGRAASAAIVVGGILAACGEPVSDEYVVHDPATLTETQNQAGIDVVQVQLTEQASTRLGIDVEEIERQRRFTEVPLSSVIYDPEGDTWVYTVPAPLTFVREPIFIATEDGQTVYLEDGPPVGTDVVTVGVPELWGAETGIGH
jgi:hypothetical protein